MGNWVVWGNVGEKGTICDILNNSKNKKELGQSQLTLHACAYVSTNACIQPHISDSIQKKEECIIKVFKNCLDFQNSP